MTTKIIHTANIEFQFLLFCLVAFEWMIDGDMCGDKSVDFFARRRSRSWSRASGSSKWKAIWCRSRGVRSAMWVCRSEGRRSPSSTPASTGLSRVGLCSALSEIISVSSNSVFWTRFQYCIQKELFYSISFICPLLIDHFSLLTLNLMLISHQKLKIRLFMMKFFIIWGEKIIMGVLGRLKPRGMGVGISPFYAHVWV